MHKLLYFVILLPLVVNFCGEDYYDFEDYDYGQLTGKVTDQLFFSQTDTIWIMGEVSAYAVGQESGDSIFIEDPFYLPDVSLPSFALARLIPPNLGINAVWAVDDFELIVKTGTIKIAACPFSTFYFYPEMNEDTGSFIFKLGLIPSRFGSYLLSMQAITFTNQVRNAHLLYDHMLVEDPLLVSWELCDRKVRRSLENSDGFYFFRVR